jgi:hypothetical protein
MLPLASYAGNVTSQWGEDGIIAEILNRIEKTTALAKWCVEFGAWDGIHLSNTYSLIRDRHFSAVLIEGDRWKYAELCLNLPSTEVIKVHRLVTLDGHSTLDAILRGTPLPRTFDLLSIDIDGCDYFIFESLRDYRPKVVCIEYNSTIPNEVDFVQERSFAIKQGCSAKAIVRLASGRGYTLAAITTTNVLLIDDVFVDPVLGSERPTLEMLRDDEDSRVFIFCGYDGTILSNKKVVTMPWHGVSFDTASLQRLPKYFRVYAGDYGWTRRLAFRLFRLFTSSPRHLLTVASRLLRRDRSRA